MILQDMSASCEQLRNVELNPLGYEEFLYKVLYITIYYTISWHFKRVANIRFGLYESKLKMFLLSFSLI